MSGSSILPKRLQRCLLLTDGPFDDAGWVFEDRHDGFRMVVKIENGKVALYSRNGKVPQLSQIHLVIKATNRRGASMSRPHRMMPSTTAFQISDKDGEEKVVNRHGMSRRS